jgi:hypothetical protein
MSTRSSQQVLSRRRIVMRAGLAVIVLASVTASVTACIFDKSDYKGGGRLDKGATAATGTTTPTDSATTTAPTTTTPAVDAASPLVDAGLTD